jgi:HEAT repeat protein
MKCFLRFLPLLVFTCALPVQAAPPPPAQGTGSSTSAQAQSASPSPWLDQLKSPDAKIRIKAAREMAKSGDLSVVGPLADALNDPSSDVRREIILALAQFRQPQALDGLIRGTKDSDPDVRTVAVRCLVGQYTGVIPTAGFTGFVKKTWRRTKSHFEEDDTKIDPGLVLDPKVVPTLQQTLNDTQSIEAARLAAWGLGVLLARSAVPDLVKAAHSRDDELAQQALLALQKIKDTSAGPQLVDLLDAPDQDVRLDAAVTVGILKATDARTKLESMYQNSTNKKVREKAIEGLAYLGQPTSAPVFLKGVWSEDATIRTSAAEGLARVGDTKNLTDVQKEYAVEKDSKVKLALLFAKCAMGDTNELGNLVDDLNSRLRGDIAQAYLTELGRKNEFLAKLYPYLDSRDSEVRRRLCLVLMYDGDQGNVPQLERLTHDNEGDVATAALRALRAIRARPASTATSGR